MAVWQAADDLQGVCRRHQELAAQDTPPGVEWGRRPIREIGQGPGVDLPALAGAFAQQDRRWRGAIGNGCDIHACILKDTKLYGKTKCSPTCLRLKDENDSITLCNKQLLVSGRGNFGSE